MNHSGHQQLSQTDIKEIKFSHEWTIRGFKRLFDKLNVDGKVTSSPFHVPTYPMTGDITFSKQSRDMYNGHQQWAKLHVNLRSDLIPLRIEIQASVRGATGLKIEASKEISYLQKNNTIDFDHFIPSNKLAAAVQNKIITIFCDITIIDFVSSNNTYSLQDNQCCLLSHFENLLKDPKYSDVTITVGSKKFCVHKLILTRSPVFAAMFEHQMKENEGNNIDITDMSEEVVEEMLQYMYTDRTEKLDEMATELLDAAEKYDLQGLKALCVQRLRSNLTYDNAAEQLIMADRYNVKEMKDHILHFISSNRRKVIETDGYKAMEETHLYLVAEAFKAV